MAIEDFEKLETPTLKKSLDSALARAKQARIKKEERMNQLGIVELYTDEDKEMARNDEKLMEYMEAEKDAYTTVIELAQALGVKLPITSEFDYDKVSRGLNKTNREGTGRT